MATSQKAEYALRAMVLLAQGGERTVVSSTIAERAKIPEKFLEAILVQLRRGGLVESRRGAEGGHRLARDSRSITVLQILEAVDGPLSLRPKDRASPVDVALRELWDRAESAVRAVLGAKTLEELCRDVEARESVVDFNI